MADTVAEKPQRIGLSGPEKMFWDEMDAMGAACEAFIQRTTRDWWPDTYTYQLTLTDGSKRVGSIPWDLDTFSKVLAHAKGSA